MTRVPPSNVQAEQQVLGALLCAEVTVYPELRDRLHHQHFSDPVNSTLYREIEVRILAGWPEHELFTEVTAGMLTPDVERRLDEVGGKSYVLALPEAYRSQPVDLQAAAKQIYDAWIRRSVLDVVAELRNQIDIAEDQVLNAGVDAQAAATTFAWKVDYVRNDLPAENAVTGVIGRYDPDEYGDLPIHSVALTRDEINLLHDHYVYAAKQTRPRKRQRQAPECAARHGYYKSRGALFAILLPPEQCDQDEVEEAFNQVVDPAIIRHDGELVDGHVVSMRHPDDPEPA